MQEPKKSYIKSAGFINDEWKVILQDGSELQGIQDIKMYANNSSIGGITLEVVPLKYKDKNENEQ